MKKSRPPRFSSRIEPQKKGFFARLFRSVHNSRASFAVYCVMVAFAVLVIIYSMIQRNWSGIFNMALMLIMLLIPAFLETTLHVEISAWLEIIAMVFVFCAQFLGEERDFYARFPVWDSILHGFSGFMFAAFGLAIVDLLSANKKMKGRPSPLFFAVAAFGFSVLIGVFWEMTEYSLDMILHTDMQKDRIVQAIATGKLNPDGQTPVVVNNIVRTVIETADGQTYEIPGYIDVGLHDTMKDLIVDSIGALIFSIIGFFYERQHLFSHLAEVFIPTVPGEGSAVGDSLPDTGVSKSDSPDQTP